MVLVHPGKDNTGCALVRDSLWLEKTTECVFETLQDIVPHSEQQMAQGPRPE